MDIVTGAGEFEGLEAWRLLVRRFDPALKSRFAGNLMEIMNWDFSGSEQLLDKLTLFDKALRIYETKTREIVSDNMRIGIVINQLAKQRDSQTKSLVEHLVFNADRLSTWEAVKAEILNIQQTRSGVRGDFTTLSAQVSSRTTSGGPAPMDIGMLAEAIDAIKAGKGKGGKPTKPKGECYKCGKPGHFAKDCRSRDVVMKDANQDVRMKDAGGKKGNGKKGKDRKCFNCGKPGHMAKDCRSKPVNEVGDEAEEDEHQHEEEAEETRLRFRGEAHKEARRFYAPDQRGR